MIRVLRSCAPILALLVLAASGCSAPSEPPPGDPAAAERVRDEFLHAWRGYVEHAWGHDGLRPLSGEGYDWYGASLLMTPLDAFDTMLLMGLEDEAARAKELILNELHFDHDVTVQLFEITIRVLGGLVSAYQLDGDARFLDLAVDLADRLLPSFESPTGMPYWGGNLRSGATSGTVMNPAEIGTLTLEFGALSKLTGDPVYLEKAKGAVSALFDRRSAIGLVGTTIDVETGEWGDPGSHVGGRIDSYYEYLLKAWLLFDDDDFRAMWGESIAALNRHVADVRETGLWYGHVDMWTGERRATRFGALDAFLPAVLALSGDIPRAERLMDSVFAMWTHHGIEPEQIDYLSMDALNPAYHLRPEALESAYTLYRLTGERKYLEMGRRMFDAIVEHCRTERGYAELVSVRTKERADRMESFFLAETLKYAYLLFAPPGTLDLDEVVFNTEAHLIRPTWR